MPDSNQFDYVIEIRWTGNRGSGTDRYESYDREYDIIAGGKAPIRGSSDPDFRGDASRYNPEELLVASLSGCHMLWYLHLCADAGLCVTGYTDKAEGRMVVGRDGGGRFDNVLLRPLVTLAPDSDLDYARALHGEAHTKCFIANSVNFPVRCEPEIQFATASIEKIP